MKNKGTKIIVFITILTLTVVTSFAQSYFTDLSKSKQGIINDPDGYVNIRKEMNTESPVVGIIVENETFNYWEVPNNNWWIVQTSNGTRGYVYSNRIKEKNKLNRTAERLNSDKANPSIEGLELIEYQTGFYEYKSLNHLELLYQPIIIMKWKNISGIPLSTSIIIDAIFIKNQTGEEMSKDSDYFQSNIDTPLQVGMSRQSTLQSSVGYVNNIGIYSADISCQIYINKQLFKTVKINNTLLSSNRIQ